MARFKLITAGLLLLVPFLTQAMARVICESPLPLAHSSTYDDSRIRDHPDKKLLANIRNYFDAFTGANFSKIAELQAPQYTMTDIPLTLYGSSKPGSFSIMEHIVRFKLAQDPPPGAEENLPPGSKKGDVLGMINISVIWWSKDGKMTQEFEYGRITWKDFTSDPWGPSAAPMCAKDFLVGLKA